MILICNLFRVQYISFWGHKIQGAFWKKIKSYMSSNMVLTIKEEMKLAEF